MEQTHKKLPHFYAKLNVLNDAMARAQTKKELFSEVCRAAVDGGLARFAWVGLGQDNTQGFEVECCSGIEAPDLECLRAASRDPITGTCPAECALREDRTVSGASIHDPVLGFVAPTAIPLRSLKRTVGVLVLYSAEGNCLQPEELGALTSVAHNLAFALESFEEKERRIRAEEKLLKSGQHYRTLFETQGEGLGILDAQLCFTFANRAAGEIFGVDAGALATRGMAEFVSADEFAKALQQQPNREHGGKSVYEIEITRPDGERRICQVTATPYTDEEGRCGTLAVFRDVTQRRHSLEALRASEERYRSLFDRNLTGVFHADLAGKILECNGAFCRIFGYDSPEEMRGMNMRQLHVDPNLRAVIVANLLKHGLITNVEHPLRRKDNRIITVLSNTTLLRDQAGEPTGAQGVILDITEQKEMVMRLEKARLAADAANRAKSVFLANMSHEIRTPMNGILGMTELVLDTDLTFEQRDNLCTVRSCAESLLSVINEVLDFSKIEAGKLELDWREFTLDEMVGETLRGLALRAHERGLELVYHVEPAIPARIVGDVDRLRQILVNLVGNAVKFTEQGEVVIHVSQDSLTDNRIGLHFSVTDTGIGIPEEKQAAIFDAFAQADSSNTRRYGGTGLGLTISARLVEAFGGRIWVESQTGKGSSFHFTAVFGRTPNQSPPAMVSGPIALAGLRVLVVDDNATNRKVLGEMLAGWDMQPTLVDGGASALNALSEQWGKGERFRLVLIDCMMPHMDGFELAERMRTDPALAGAKVMMLTSNNALGAAARCRALGLSAYLVKPVRKSELLQTITSVLSQRPKENPTQAGRSPEGAEQGRKLRILLAEDNVVNQQLAVRLLQREGHVVEVAVNGRMAVQRHAENSYDAVLMDVQMPEMDGLEATAAIRAREADTGRRTPIIAMTAHTMVGDRERCLLAGMDGYIAKPIQRRELLETLQFHCFGNKQRQNESRPSADFSAALQRYGGDKELLGDMCDVYLAEQPRMLNAIREAVAQKNPAALHSAAHALKGSISTFGAARVCNSALKLESMGRNANLGEAEQELEILNREIESFVPALTELRKEMLSEDPGRG